MPDPNDLNSARNSKLISNTRLNIIDAVGGEVKKSNKEQLKQANIEHVNYLASN